MLLSGWRRDVVVVPLYLPLLPGIVVSRLPVERVRAPGVQPIVEPLRIVAHVAVIALVLVMTAAATPSTPAMFTASQVGYLLMLRSPLAEFGPFGLDLVLGGAPLDHLINDPLLPGLPLLLVVRVLEEIWRRLLVILP